LHPNAVIASGQDVMRNCDGVLADVDGVIAD